MSIYIVLFVLFAPFLSLADHSNTHTIATLQQKIKELQAQVDALKSSASSAGAVFGNRPPKITIVPPIPESIEPGGEFSFTWLAWDPDTDDLVWSIDWGDGTKTVIPCPRILVKSKERWKFTATHLWIKNGMHKGNVTVSDCRGGEDTSSFTVTVEKKAFAPVVKAVYGPKSIPAGGVGTWTVDAYDPDKGSLTYGASWNDKEEVLPVFAELLRSGATQATPTFIHSFKTQGTYQPVFSVTDNDGMLTEYTLTVTVGDASVPAIRILSPNGGETWLVGSRQIIQWSSKGISPDHRIALVKLREIYSGWEGDLITNAVNDGIEEIVVPFPIKSAIPGSYFLEIRTIVNSAIVRDESDAPFEVVASINRSAPKALTASVFHSIYTRLQSLSAKLEEIKQSLGY